LLGKEYYIDYRTQEPRVDIVISRYAESLDWLCEDFFLSKLRKDRLYHLIIYNKGDDLRVPSCLPHNVSLSVIRLPNVGRCDHTYLYHIYHYYNSLADITIFLPGSCDMQNKIDRTKKIINYAIDNVDTALICEEHKDVKTKFYDFYLDNYVASNAINAEKNKDAQMQSSSIRPFGSWFESVFGKDEVINCINFYGIFAVSRADIHKREKNFYSVLLDMLDKHNNPEVGHYIERSWFAIFQPSHHLTL
jgi:hypothetical protein